MRRMSWLAGRIFVSVANSLFFMEWIGQWDILVLTKQNLLKQFRNKKTQDGILIFYHYSGAYRPTQPLNMTHVLWNLTREKHEEQIARKPETSLAQNCRMCLPRNSSSFCKIIYILFKNEFGKRNVAWMEWNYNFLEKYCRIFNCDKRLGNNV